jgi:lipopolysaccharide/colanic/teichoic acid biosynthesis glycosyltransferase
MTTEFHLGRRPVKTAATADTGMPRTAAGRPTPGTWWLASDVTALTAAAVGHTVLTGGSVEAYATAAMMIALAGLCLVLTGAWDHGATGLAPLLRGFATAAATIALGSLALGTSAGRAWAFVVLPVAWLLATAGRLALRPVLRRRSAQAVVRVLAVGTDEAVASLVERVRQTPRHGWQVVAACTPTGAGPGGRPGIGDVPVLGDLDSVPLLARSGQFDTVSVAPTGGWTRQRLQRLVPYLDYSDTDLVLDPDLAGCAGSRTRLVGLDGLHLLRLAPPAIPASAQVLKSGLDRTVALSLLVLTAPLLLTLALAARLDGGPALVRHPCVDARGRTFGMLTFRTEGGRATRISAFVRRHGLEALPQLLNVLAGSMAVVGPRPSSSDEVARRVRHAPLVAPGLTGLGGLPDAERLDGAELESRYAENWSPALDLQLLASALRSACRRMPR